MFIKYSTNQILPKKRRGKGLKGKKTADESQETIDVSEEFELEPEPAKKKTASKRVVKKKVTLSVDDNIISDDPDAALGVIAYVLIIQPKAEEDRSIKGKVHVYTSRSKRNKKIQQTTTKRTGGLQMRDTLGFIDEEKDITQKERFIQEWEHYTDSEFSDDYNDDVEKYDKDGNADDEGVDHVSDTQHVDDEDDETESDEDESILSIEIQVRTKEMRIRDKVYSDTLEAKDDTKKSELPPSSSSLSVSLGFGDQFLKLSSNSSLVSTIKDSSNTNVSSLLDIPI
ncbi:hypothetical protein Tco_0052768 [Tanacetum coccineum]